jgi:hypothetical protein
MNSISHFHNCTPEEIAANPRLNAALQSAFEVVQEAAYPLYTGKSSVNRKFNFSQVLANVDFEQAFMDHGWAVQPRVVEGYFSDFDSGIGVDRTLIEVELGNGGRLLCDFSKFLHASEPEGGGLGLGILIVPTSKLASRTDTGLSTFQGALDRLNHFAKGCMAFKAVVIGIEPPTDDSVIVDWSESNFTLAEISSKTSTAFMKNHAIRLYRGGVPLADIQPPTDGEVADVLCYRAAMERKPPPDKAALKEAFKKNDLLAQLRKRQQAERSKLERTTSFSVYCGQAPTHAPVLFTGGLSALEQTNHPPSACREICLGAKRLAEKAAEDLFNILVAHDQAVASIHADACNVVAGIPAGAEVLELA